jgi:YbbR domain-containing protein
MLKNNSPKNENSWIARIMAVIVACILWVYVMNEQNPITTRNFVVSLTPLNLQENMMVKDLPDSVNVRISGTRSQIASLRNSDVTAYIDFTDAPKGRGTYNVMATTKVGEVTEISPSLLQLETDVMSSKEVKLEARIVGVPHSGVTVSKMELNPTTVTIRGAGERIALVEKVLVMVDISNHDKNFETEATAVAVDHNGREMYDVKVDPSKIQTAVTIVRQLGTNEFPIKANLSGKLPEGYTLVGTKITPSSVKLTADPKVLGQITEIQTAPIVLDNISDSVELKMPLQIPDQVMAETHSVIVEITVKKADAGNNNDSKAQ